MDLVRIVTSFVLLVFGLTLAVCTSAVAVRAPSGPPTVRGTLTDVRHSATASGLVVEAPGDACGMRATADAETRVLRRAPDGRLSLVGVGASGIGALAAGDAVEVWADGPVMESCPLQGRAAVVVVGAASGADTGLLVGRWVHAAEEDAGGVEVYRPEGAREFPPRMYRQRYVFDAGGRAEALVPHPADAHYLAEGTWTLDPDRPDVLRVRYEGRTDVLRVVELRDDLLRVERIENGR